ncbi:MAG: aspartate aminotransferase family protein [bacterium]|nr:aspartate aminotransferase family protein [bacterium]
MSQKSVNEKTAELLKIREKNVPGCLSHLTKIIVDKAEGSWIEDVDGNRYLDFGAGIAVVSAGNCHPKIVKAVQDQAGKCFHTCFHIIMQEPYIRLAEKVTGVLPGETPKKVMFLNSGAEAIENAIKFVRVYTGRKALAAPEHGFHGRTYGALALTSKTKPLKEGLEPFIPEVYRIPYAYCYRCPVGKEYPGCNMACVDAIEDMFATYVAAESIAGIFLEPVIGEGGVIIPPKEYIQGLRKICDKYGILLVFDEIQTGFARTGRMFAQEHFDVEPDLTVMAKGIANGMPLSAVAGKADIMDKPNTGAVGSTYGGNPLTCAAGNAMIDVIMEENLVGRSEKIGKYMLSKLKKLESEYEFVGEVRGLGMMIGIECVKDKTSREPFKDRAGEIIEECVKKGLIVVRAGARGNIVRILPPLNTKDEDVDTGLDIILDVFKRIK